MKWLRVIAIVLAICLTAFPLMPGGMAEKAGPMGDRGEAEAAAFAEAKGAGSEGSAFESPFPWICAALGLAVLAGANLALYICLSRSIRDERRRFLSFASRQGGRTARWD